MPHNGLNDYSTIASKARRIDNLWNINNILVIMWFSSNRHDMGILENPIYMYFRIFS